MFPILTERRDVRAPSQAPSRKRGVRSGVKVFPVHTSTGAMPCDKKASSVGRGGFDCARRVRPRGTSSFRMWEKGAPAQGARGRE